MFATTKGPIAAVILILLLTGCVAEVESPTPQAAKAEPDKSYRPAIPGELLSDGGVADAVENVLPAVVKVITSDSSGTGFIVSPDGLVVTNRHVVKGARQVSVALASGDQLQGRVTGQHESADLAYIQIENRDTFETIPTGDSDALRVGDEVIAVGYPLGSLLVGMTPTVSVGIVSAKRDGLIQTDASLNPGNSGGPLLNTDGQVVGVVVSRLEEDNAGRPIEGVGFAIPINEVDVDEAVPPSAPSPPGPGQPAAPTPVPTPRATPLPVVPGTAWVVVEEGPDPVTDAVTVTLLTDAVEHNMGAEVPTLVLVCRSTEVATKGDRVWVEWGKLLKRETRSGQSTILLRWDDEPVTEKVWAAAWAQDIALLPFSGNSEAIFIDKAKGHETLRVRIWGIFGSEFNAQFDLDGLADILSNYDDDLCSP